MMDDGWIWMDGYVIGRCRGICLYIDGIYSYNLYIYICYVFTYVHKDASIHTSIYIHSLIKLIDIYM